MAYTCLSCFYIYIQIDLFVFISDQHLLMFLLLPFLQANQT